VPRPTHATAGPSPTPSPPTDPGNASRTLSRPDAGHRRTHRHLTAQAGEPTPNLPRPTVPLPPALLAGPLTLDAVFDQVPAGFDRFADLLALPADQRTARIRGDAAFHVPFLARLLLHQAVKPRLTRRLAASAHDRAVTADLALAVAERLPPRLPAPCHPLLPKALSLCGRLWTRLGDERRAESRFRRLAAILRTHPTAAGSADLCHGLAQLRWRQQLLDEAIALFIRAADLWTDHGSLQNAALAHAQLGFVHLDAGADLGEIAAGTALQLAHNHLEPRVPALTTRIVLGLAFCHAALGKQPRAAELRHLAPHLLDPSAPAATAAADRLLLQWWDARIEALAGRPAEAETQLDAVRHQLLAHGSLAEAARASLDLAEVRIALRQPRRLAGLGPDLLQAFAPGAATRIAARFATLARIAATNPSDDTAVAAAEDAIRAAVSGLRHLDPQRPPCLSDLTTLADQFLSLEIDADEP
jgi:tetratricopeptide (TPR) repeat protein